RTFSKKFLSSISMGKDADQGNGEQQEHQGAEDVIGVLGKMVGLGLQLVKVEGIEIENGKGSCPGRHHKCGDVLGLELDPARLVPHGVEPTIIGEGQQVQCGQQQSLEQTVLFAQVHFLMGYFLLPFGHDKEINGKKGEDRQGHFEQDIDNLGVVVQEFGDKDGDISLYHDHGGDSQTEDD